MEQDRDVDQILMNVRNSTGGIIAASVFSARISFKLLVFLMRLVKKGLLAAGFADNFKGFTQLTNGNYTVYNIPVSGANAEKLVQLNKLELELDKTNNPVRKAAIRNEIKKLQKEMPEIEQIKKLGISHCVLPKLNGSENTIQIAIAKKDDQLFKNWFLNHLTTNMAGGEKGLEDIKVFTEGNYGIFNVPFEGEELEAAFPDFETLGLNYAVLPDLKVGDGNSQIVVPNADRNKLEVWFRMWKDKQLREGKEPGEMYVMNQNSYMETSRMDAGTYMNAAEQKYKNANAEYEMASTAVPWNGVLQKENSEEYVRLLQDNNYEKITINKETLVEKMDVSDVAMEMQKNGYFISRIPTTYGESQQTLILPTDQVFVADDGKTFLAFLPKNQGTMVADNSGNIMTCAFEEVKKPYDKVTRNMGKVDALKKGVGLTKEAVPKVPVPTPKL